MGAAIIARRDPAPVLETADHVLDAMPLAIQDFVVGKFDLAAACGGNAWGDTAFEQGRAELIAVVTAIGDQLLGWRQCAQDQRRTPVVAHLSFGEQQQDRTALPVADGVQLGVQAALGASDAARNSPF